MDTLSTTTFFEKTKTKTRFLLKLVLHKAVQQQWTTHRLQQHFFKNDENNANHIGWSSCINATMLDTLESQVSESLADRYDIVMPEGDREPVPAANEVSDLDRLTRVLEQERGPQ